MELVTMPLPTPITKTRANELTDELSVMWERLSKIAREMDEHGEYETNTRIKRAAGAVWGARRAIQTRAATLRHVEPDSGPELDTRLEAMGVQFDSGTENLDPDDDDIDPRSSYRNE